MSNLSLNQMKQKRMAEKSKTFLRRSFCTIEPLGFGAEGKETSEAPVVAADSNLFDVENN
jgi:hypothetical protein